MRKKFKSIHTFERRELINSFLKYIFTETVWVIILFDNLIDHRKFGDGFVDQIQFAFVNVLFAVGAFLKAC